MHFIVLFALIASARSVIKNGGPETLIRVYLPVMLLLPDSFRVIIPGIPKPTFSQAAAIPLLYAFLKSHRRDWQFSLTDVLVFGFASVLGYSEYYNTNYSEAQNLMWNMGAWVVIPYIAGKAFIEPYGNGPRVARTFVMCVFGTIIFSLYEFKFGVNVYQHYLSLLFPGQGEWGITFRYGFARISGPWAHCILAGVVIATAYRLHMWLQWNNLWEPYFQRFRSMEKSKVIRYVVFLGSIMTIARGPWIGAVAGGVLTFIGRQRNRKMAGRVILALLIICGIPAGKMFVDYVSINRFEAKTPSQESAAYRKELLDKYMDIAAEKSWLGWGKNTWPRVLGMPSIDNYFLLLALMHGMIALTLLISIFLWMGVRCFRRAMRDQQGLDTSDIGFTFSAIYLMYFISIATVFMGEQVIPIFFLITGWAESYLQRGSNVGQQATSATNNAPAFSFRIIY